MLLGGFLGNLDMAFPRDPGSPSENGNGTQIIC